MLIPRPPHIWQNDSQVLWALSFDLALQIVSEEFQRVSVGSRVGEGKLSSTTD